MVIPTSAFHEKSEDVSAVFRFFGDFVLGVIVDYLEVEVEFIDCDCVFACEVLEQCGEVSLWEDEARDPNAGWASRLCPLSPELNPF